MTRWQFSSSGWRNQTNPWFRVGTLEVTTTVLIVAIGVVTMIMWAANPSTFDSLFFATPLVKDGEVWRVVTWPLINEPGIWTALTLALFYLFGREVESLLGRNRFLVFLAIIVVIPSVIALGLSFLGGDGFETGASGLRLIQFGVFAAYIAERPFARAFFGLPLWALFAIILAMDSLQLIGLRLWLSLILELLIVATSLFLTRGWGFADEVEFIPRLAIPGGPNASRKYKAPKPAKSRAKAAGSGSVVAGPWPTSPPGAPLPPPPGFSDQRQLDDLLDKVASKGLDGLSSTERKQLDELSKKLRGQK